MLASEVFYCILVKVIAFATARYFTVKVFPMSEFFCLEFLKEIKDAFYGLLAESEGQRLYSDLKKERKALIIEFKDAVRVKNETYDSLCIAEKHFKEVMRQSSDLYSIWWAVMLRIGLTPT